MYVTTVHYGMSSFGCTIHNSESGQHLTCLDNLFHCYHYDSIYLLREISIARQQLVTLISLDSTDVAVY